MIEVPKIVGPVPEMIKQTLNYIKTNVIKKQILKQKDKAESITYFPNFRKVIQNSCHKWFLANFSFLYRIHLCNAYF